MDILLENYEDAFFDPTCSVFSQIFGYLPSFCSMVIFRLLCL